MITASIRTGSTAKRELRAMMRGRVVSRGDDDYPRTRQVWNRAVEDQPALFAVCETSADVQAAVRSARQHRLPLSVRGGAHDWVGRALRPKPAKPEPNRLKYTQETRGAGGEVEA